MIPNGLECSQMFPNDPKCFQMFPNDPKCFKTVQNNPKWSQMFSNDPMWSQRNQFFLMVLSGPKEHHVMHLCVVFHGCSDLIVNLVKWLFNFENAAMLK